MFKTLVILAAVAGATIYIARKIAMSAQETVDRINALTAKVEKIGGETRTLLDKVQELTDALASAGDISPEVQAALDALSAQVDVVDDLVPDAAPAGDQPQG